MAYAGTPTGLAQQAGASRPWKTLLPASAVLAIGLVLVIAVMFIGSRAVAPTVDRGSNQIEAQRGAAALSGAAAKSTWIAVDSSRGLPPVTSFVSEDKPAAANQSAVEAAAAAKARAMSGVPAAIDNSYNAVENARGVATFTGTTFDPSQVDQSRGAHGQLP